MKKVLFVATVVKTHIMVFHLPYLKWFKENGYETYVCARNDYENPSECVIPYCDKYYDIPFERSPLKLNNVQAYRRLKNIIDSNEFDLIHCHTPVGGAITRLAARKSRYYKGTSVLYTAHGFHFFKGAPLKNWILYYPVEKFLSCWTDALITINAEDYINAKKLSVKKITSVHKVSGVGIDLNKFKPQTVKVKSDLRKQYGYRGSDLILIFVGELNLNKNQDLLIKAIDIVKYSVPNIKLLLVGDGLLKESYKKLVVELGLKDTVEFLGYRSDISKLMALSDVALSSSKREGLPINVMEAMAIGLPLVVTDSRGNRDLVADGVNGYVEENDVEKFGNSITEMLICDEQRANFGNSSLDQIEKYSLDNVLDEMEKVYYKYMGFE